MPPPAGRTETNYFAARITIKMKKISFICFVVLLTCVLARETFSQAKPVIVALSKTDSTLAIIDAATMKVTAKVPTRANPHEVVISSAGNNIGRNTTGRELCLATFGQL